MQTDGRSPAADAAVTSSEASSQGVRRCLAWWGGRGCRDGAPGLLKGTREGPWPRWFSSAAAGAFGEENRGGGECSRKREGAAREEEERGDTRRPRGVAREAGEAGAGRGIASARHRAASVRGEEDDRRRVGWAALGRSCWATRWASQVSPGGSALFFIILFCFIFSIFCNLFLI